MKIKMGTDTFVVDESVIIEEFKNILYDSGRVDLNQPNLKADDMLKTISALDSRYDYSIYKSFNDQFIVIALLKGEKDTILDMQYMTINSIKSWYDDKMDEFLNKEREENTGV